MAVPAFRSGEFLIDPAKRILLRDGAPLTLPPKAFDVIVYLVAERERAVGRDELIAAIWGRADITDNALGQVVLQARRALDDGGEQGQRRILTVPRFGYRWIAEVESVESVEAGAAPVADAPVAPSTEHAQPAPSRHPHARVSAAIAIVALAAIAFASWAFIAHRHAPMRASASANAVVVLPVGVDAPPAFAWVRLGVMDLVAQRLRAAGQPVVPSDNVVGLARHYTGSDGAIDATSVARAVGANAVVTASAKLDGGRWQVALAMPGRGASGEGADADVISAARIAADRLALAIGLDAPGEMTGTDAFVALLQKVRAAILSEQLDTARSLLLDAPAEDRARPEIRFHLAEIDFRSGHLEKALRSLRDLLDDGAVAESPLLEAKILNALGNIAYQQNDYTATIRYSDRVLDVLAHEDAPDQIGRAYIGRANARSNLNDFEQAIADYGQARVMFEAAGDRLALARVDAYLGLLEIGRDRNAEALPLLRGAVERFKSFDAVVEELHSRVGIVMAELAMLDPASALAECPRLADLAARVSDVRRKSYADLVCADADLANGDFSGAALKLRDVRARSNPPETTLIHQSRLQLHRIAGELALAVGDPAAAADQAAAGLVLPADFDSAGARARLQWILIRAEIALGRLDAADATARDAADWATRHAEPDVHVYASLAVAEAARVRHDDAAAKTAFEAAVEAADASRMPVDLLAAASAYGEDLLVRGDLAEAGTVIARVAPWSAKSFDAALLEVRLYHALNQAEPWRAALAHARELAGERSVPAPLRTLKPVLDLDTAAASRSGATR